MSRPRLPGPGNRFVTTWRFMRDPYTCYRNWKRQYGDTFLVKALNGDVVATCDRENIRRLFAAPSDAVGQFAIETTKPLLGGLSVILVEGEQHRRERAILSPGFHGERIAPQADVVREVATRVGHQWEPGQTVRIMDATLDVSLEVIIRVVFGVQSDQRIEIYKQAIKEFVSSFHPALAFSRLLHRPLLGLSPWSKFTQARAVFHDLLIEEIETRRASGQSTGDVLSRMLEARYDDGQPMTKENIRDQLVTLLLAGHETTQIAMAWAMSWLHRYPETLVRLRDELKSTSNSDDILKNEYLNGVCNESLRLNSVVSDTVRKLRKPMEFVEQEMPAGTNVAIAICLVHEDPELYPEPFEFRPERWLDRKFKPNEFMPFGGGIRRCLGAPLAILEMKMTIATWLTEFEFALPQDAPDVEPVYRRNITMAPRSGIPLVVQGHTNKAH